MHFAWFPHMSWCGAASSLVTSVNCDLMLQFNRPISKQHHRMKFKLNSESPEIVHAAWKPRKVLTQQGTSRRVWNLIKNIGEWQLWLAYIPNLSLCSGLQRSLSCPWLQCYYRIYYLVKISQRWIELISSHYQINKGGMKYSLYRMEWRRFHFQKLTDGQSNQFRQELIWVLFVKNFSIKASFFFNQWTGIIDRICLYPNSWLPACLPSVSL